MPNKGPIGLPMMEVEMKVLGIDVGLTGAIAVMRGDRLVDVVDMPTMGQKGKDLDAAMLRQILEGMMPADLVVVEEQGPAPGQGLGSTFELGWQSGCIQGMLVALGVNFLLVRPGVWKAGMRLSGDKELSRKAARKLWPTQGFFERKRDHGRAEAALIAKWAQLARAREAVA